jgi:hypothetical protein
MTPASFFTGAPPGNSGQKKEIEKPRPSPAGPRKSLYAVFSARETSLVHPLKVDSRMREGHTIVAVRLKPRMTILLKCRMPFAMPAAIENGRPVAELRAFVNSSSFKTAHRGAAVRLTQPDWMAPVCVPFHNWDHI